MRRTIAPPPDLPRPTPNPEQIADPCREVVDPWGASAKLTDDEKAQLAGWVWQGPDLQNDGVGWYKPITWNWRNTDDVSQSRHQIELRSYPSVL
jgi:hypothetical protein